MLRMGLKSIISIIAVFTLYTCIDPYTPKLRGYDTLLVVDGLITDENSSYSIQLSKTIQEQDAVPEKVTDATVFITDEADNSNFLIYQGEGKYKTDSISFRGAVGTTYTLHIITSDGTEYISDPCKMLPVPAIDSVYFMRSENLINNGTETEEGITIYIDSKPDGSNSYYRWDFDETWKFKVPSPKKYDYLGDEEYVPVADVNEFCWKMKKSDVISIESVVSLQKGSLQKKPVQFIATDKSDRLMMQYSILINQYSISKTEYDFWNNLKSINETGGDVFSTQPYPVMSNIHNISNPDEKVLGYFQVSAVSKKRKEILLNDILDLDLPLYHTECVRLELSPDDIPMPKFAPPLTWDGLYRIYCITSDYYFVEPLVSTETNSLVKMVFALPECADCLLTGTNIKPDFWVDYE